MRKAGDRLTVEEQNYKLEVQRMEDCTLNAVINMKRYRKLGSYKELYEVKLLELKLLELAKDKLIEYSETDILKLLNVKFGDSNYFSEYMKYRVLTTGLYSGSTKRAVVENAKKYLKLIGKK